MDVRVVVERLHAIADRPSTDDNTRGCFAERLTIWTNLATLVAVRVFGLMAVILESER